MKKKLTVKSLLFYWLFSIVTLKTHGAVKLGHGYQSSFRVVRNVPNLSFFHHKTANDMRVHIKKVLNVQINNSTLDKYISSIFNLNNVNPTYVFRLPDNRNQTLVLRKSDFSAAVFPNVTNVNKFKKPADKLEVSSSIKRPVALKSEDSIDELKHEKRIFDNNISGNFEDEDDMMHIVNENVRSEEDFIKLMNEMNDDLNEEDLRQIQHQKLVQPPKKKKAPKQKISEEDQWEELGLSGWTGTVAGSKELLPKKEKPKHPKKLVTALAPLYTNFELSLIKTSQNFEKNKNQYKSEEDEIEMDDLADQLSAILLKDEQVLLNKTGRLPNQTPRWPITTKRDKHGDNDVFLARANNPFGHSTKWKYNNNSDTEPHREGRSKRGVYHLYSMIKCATGCDPLVYKGYGCYCGFLGAGKALDGIDRCCKAHDYCYTSANCIFYTEYFVPYLWKCYRGKPLCAIDNGEWGGPGSCASRLCQCDLALSKCLRHYYCPQKRPVCVSSPFRLLQNLVMVF